MDKLNLQILFVSIIYFILYLLKLNFRKETEFVEEIVKDIYRRLHKMISDLPQLFGMGDSIEFITSWLKDDSSESYRGGILTILGMGGI